MLSKAWDHGKQDRSSSRESDDEATDKAKRLKDFLEWKIPRIDKEKIRQWVYEMGKKDDLRRNLNTWRFYRNDGCVDNLKADLAEFDPKMPQIYTWTEITNTLKEKIVVDLEELTNDRDYHGLYAELYTGTTFVPGENDSLVFFSLLGLYGKNVTAIKCDLVLKKNNCTIL